MDLVGQPARGRQVAEHWIRETLDDLAFDRGSCSNWRKRTFRSIRRCS